MTKEKLSDTDGNTEENKNFACQVRDIILSSEPRSACCKSSLSCGIKLFAKKRRNPYTEDINEFCEKLDRPPKKKKKNDLLELMSAAVGYKIKTDESGKQLPDPCGGTCSECFSNLLKGCFLSAGRMGDPQKSLYLELSMPNAEAMNFMAGALTEHGLEPKCAVRRGEHLIYYKRTETIGDVLNYMGAYLAFFKIADAAIYKEFMGNANRRTNCDTANIKKTVEAAARQITAITAIAAAGMLDALPSGIKDTVRIRLEHPEVSLTELIALHPYHITRSGVQHRLKKAVQFAEQKGYISPI